jgi:outer membrane immunogenic protein
MKIAAIILVAILLGGAPIPRAVAQEAVGGAVAIIRDVHQTYSGETTPLNVGDRVLQNQVISTATSSEAKLEFSDRTQLQIAPISTVKIDRFVYAGGGGAKQLVFNAATGAFRFVSGYTHNYTVRTPTATLGIRGTAFAVRVLPSRTDVVLYNGKVSVCARHGAACNDLTSPCTYVTATANSVTAPEPVTGKTWSFDRSCSPGSAINFTDAPSASRADPSGPAAPASPALSSPAQTKTHEDRDDHRGRHEGREADTSNAAKASDHEGGRNTRGGRTKI